MPSVTDTSVTPLSVSSRTVCKMWSILLEFETST